MPENLTRQILREHLTDGELTPGEAISLRVDQTLLQDATGTMALMQFEQLDVPGVKVERALQYLDHNVIQLDYKNPDDHRMLQALCRKYGIHYSRPGNGNIHRRNLVAQGILALTFEDEADYERAKGGGLRIEESGDEFSVTHDFAPKERDILVSGGLLHYLSENAPA